MRSHRQIVDYRSILDVLSEPGCPFCRVLKDFQAARPQSHSEPGVQYLCNFHTWGLAAVQDAAFAAEVFIGLIEQAPQEPGDYPICRICEEVLAEENMRIREFADSVKGTEVRHWLNAHAVLCIPHGMKLKKRVPLGCSVRIEEIVTDTRHALAQELRHLRDERAADRSGWGVFGRAAEFLVAQRGLKA